MKKIVQQSKIHYYILLLILLCPCVHATTSRKAASNAKQQKSETKQPVHTAAINGNMEFFTQLSEKDGIEKILNKKDTSHNNWTPLHYATAHNQAAIVGFILAQRGIQVNAITKEKGLTALHILIKNQHFNLLDYFIDYKEKERKQQKEQDKQFTCLFLHKKDKASKTPFEYFPQEKNEQLTQKWDKLVGKQPKKSKPKPQQKPLNLKQKDSQASTPKPPLPTNISMAPLSPTTSDDGITFSPSSVTNASIAHNTVQNQAMGISKTASIQPSPIQSSSHSQATQPIITETISMIPLSPKPTHTVGTSSPSSVANDHTPVPDQMIATIQQLHKQSSHSQTAQPITTKTKKRARISEKSQQHSSAHHTPQQGRAANTISPQVVQATIKKEVNLFYYLQFVVGVLLLGSIFYLIATQLNRKAFRKSFR